MTHPTWELPVTENSAGLVLTPCPGTKDLPLVESIEQLRSQGVTVVVTALSHEEMQEKGVGDLPKVVEQAGLQWFHARPPVSNALAKYLPVTSSGAYQGR